MLNNQRVFICDSSISKSLAFFPGLFATEQLFVVPRRAALSLLGTLQVTMPAMADEIDDEVAEYIKQMRSAVGHGDQMLGLGEYT
jgi:hypothetical protein